MVKYCPEEYQREATRWMVHFTDWQESIIGILKDGKIPFKDFYDFAWNKLCNVEMMDKPANKALIPVILEKINQNQEYYDDIKDIVTNYYGKNKKFLDFCFNHLENREWAKCFEVFDNSEYYGHYSFKEFIDILSILDTKEVPVYTENGRIGLAQYADSICTNLYRYLGDGVNKGGYCREVIEKIKELMISGELKNILTQVGETTLVYDNPDFCNVLDALAKSEREGLDKTLVQGAFDRIRGGSDKRDNNFAENYQEIIDFYIKNQDVVNKDNAEVYKLIRNLETQDVQLLEKTLEYCKKINSPEVIKIIADTCKGDIKQFLDFFDKVDFEKYGREVNSLLSQMRKTPYENNFKYMNLLLSDKLSKENIEFILDIEKLLNESFYEADDLEAFFSNSSPKSSSKISLRPKLNNDFFEIFTDGEIPEEVLNKLRFYIENQISIAKEQPDYRIKLGRIIDLINIYKLRPDKIDFFEKYLFSGNEDMESFIHSIVACLAYNKGVLGKQLLLDKKLAFLDDILSYDRAEESRYRIEEVLNASNNNIEAQLEIWEMVKPKDKKPKRGELSEALYLVSYARAKNKNVIKAAYNKKFGNNSDIANLACKVSSENESLIIDMIDSGKYSPDFIISIANRTYYPLEVELAKEILADGTFEEEQVTAVLSALGDDNYDLAKELCFNKDINFPKSAIPDILRSSTDKNQDLAWKLCTSKVRQSPEDKIPCYGSYDNTYRNVGSICK